jgi:pimeloyl-ACP methyl ester carboxylesterase
VRGPGHWKALTGRSLLLLGSCLLVACASVPSPAARGQTALALVAARGWQPIALPAGRFTLAAFVPAAVVPAETLTVYIEGDGLAWISSDTPSADPTPRDPIGLKLALAHPAGAAVYLARPCQYLGGEQPSGCGQAYWTDRRFAPEVVAATAIAVDALKRRYGARWIQLVGYSGGGAVAALVAAQRSDVRLLATVAGNLDTLAWTTHFRVTPLGGSLNPADFSGQLANVPQMHWVGAADAVMPPLVAGSYAARFAPESKPQVRVIDGYDHVCCWAQNWARLWSDTPH